MSETETQFSDVPQPGTGSDAPGTSDPDRPAPVAPGDDGTVRLGRNGPVAARQLTRRGRVRKWDRQPPPKDWRWYVGNVGKTLIAVGLLMFGFVGYQLYGTGIETAAAQNELQDEFEQQLALVDPPTPDFSQGDPTVGDAPGTSDGVTDDTTDVVVPGEVTVDAEGVDVEGVDQEGVAAESVEEDPFSTPDEAATPDAVPVAAQNIPPDLANGEAIARIEIPRIGVDDIVVAGVDTGDLKRGPGHFPNTPLPGQLGNSAIAGHRTTYGQPFRNVDQLRVDDEIRVTTLNGIFVYRVTGQTIVAPSEYQVVATTDPTVANLTLTSCHPVFTARERIVIFSELDRTESARVGEPVINYGRTEVVEAPAEIPGDEELAGDDEAVADPAVDRATPETGSESTGSLDDVPSAPQPGSEVVNEEIADAFSEGWFSDPAANSQVGIWGAIVGLIAIAAYAISRRFRRDLVGLAIGLVPFTLALYFFFQNVNRLLPPNL